MDSLERLMSTVPHQPALTAASRSQNAFVQASLCSVIGRKGRHLTGTFCLTGDTMEGIIQCLVFLKAFSLYRSSVSNSNVRCVNVLSMMMTMMRKTKQG
ncbi:hypothetical protein TSAR_015136 [Trichomalopsis sarcophagae]|uniref:Uncharacterized protein n=1 Tax=Trichomalopsis sarcophagae TaxID=543379 RepID=A0A232F0X8_9HYME|nr:hypothetical protein TSAR_015136 [Trichomalopsis sarcophagae]